MPGLPGGGRSGSMRRLMIRRLRDALGALLVGLLPFGVYWRLWVSGPRAQHLYGDTNGLYWPDLVFLHHALVHGQLPLWDPFERGGVSMLSEPEAGVLYPLNWGLAALAAVGGGMPFAMIEVKQCLHMAIGGIAMFAFLRRRRAGPGAAALGAVIFELGPYTTGNAHFALIWPQAWLPLVMLATDWLLEGGALPAAMLTAAATYLMVVSGSPPTAYYGVLVAAPYLAVRAATQARRDGLRPWLRRYGVPLLVAGALAALSCYPSVRGTYEAMRSSQRAVRSFEYVAESPLPVAEWMGLFLRAGSGVHVYLGVPACMLAIFGALRWRARAEAATFAGLAVFGALLMLGRATPLLHFLYDYAPPFRLFRICVRYVFVVQTAVAVLAAQGFEALPRLRTPDRAGLRAAALAVGLPVVAAIGLLVLARVHPWRASPELADDVRDGWLAAGATVLLGALAVWRPRFAGAAGALVAALVAADLGAAASRAGTLRPGRFDPATPGVSAPWVARLQADTDQSRVFAEFGLAWRAGNRLALRDLRGYLEPLAEQRVLDVYAAIARSPALLGLFNVRWLLHSGHPYQGLSHNFVKSADGVPGIVRREGAVYEIEPRAPYAYWVGGAVVEPTVAAALRRLPELDRRGELVLAEEDTGPVPPARRAARAPRVDATLEGRTLSSLRFSVDAPADGYLVVNEAWFPGWVAEVDGRPARVVPANVMMQALEVGAGAHVVELRFRPGYVLVPLALAFAAWAGVIAWLVVLLRRRGTLCQREEDPAFAVTAHAPDPPRLP